MLIYSLLVADPPEPSLPYPAHLVATLRDRGQTLAVAESLTGGLLAATLVDVPGVSAILRGAIVAYAIDLKSALLGVPVDLLNERGAVDPDVAVAMAAGVRERCGADWALSSTGVAGPDPQDGIAPGTAFVAVAGPGGTAVRALALDGDRVAVRRGTVIAALSLLAHHLGDLAQDHAPESSASSGWGPDVDVAGSG